MLIRTRIAAYYAPEDETGIVEKKSATEVQRENIKVTNNEDKEDVEEEKEEIEIKEEEIEEKTDDEDEKEEVVEVKENKSVEKLERTIARLQKRIDKTTGTNKTLERELADAKVRLEIKQAEGDVVLTEEEVERRAEEKANKKSAEREFTNACNRLAKNAVKIDKDFDDKVKSMAEDIGPIPSQMIGILDDLDNGGEVLSHLTNNVEDAEEIYALSLSKMSTRLAKLSLQLEEKAKKPKKEISKVPAPNDPIAGGSKTTKFDPRDTKTNDAKTWIEKRNVEVAVRQAAKRAAMR